VGGGEDYKLELAIKRTIAMNDETDMPDEYINVGQRLELAVRAPADMASINQPDSDSMSFNEWLNDDVRRRYLWADEMIEMSMVSDD
jgi:hypothetical protein